MLPHAHDLWNERANNKNDVWHIDLIGKFRSPSLGGNHYDLIKPPKHLANTEGGFSISETLTAQDQPDG